VSDIAPGWYKDPADPTTQRYWDGDGWIGDPVPADAQAPDGPPVAVHSPPDKPLSTPAPNPAPEAEAGSDPVSDPVSATQTTLPVVINGHQIATAAQLQQAMLAGLIPPPRPHGFALAPLSARFVARMIDILVLFGLNVLVNGWFVYQYLKEIKPYVELFQQQVLANQDTSGITVPDRASNLVFAILGIAMVLWFAYEVPAIASSG
jgi:hypothetical protein